MPTKTAKRKNRRTTGPKETEARAQREAKVKKAEQADAAETVEAPPVRDVTGEAPAPEAPARPVLRIRAEGKTWDVADFETPAKFKIVKPARGRTSHIVAARETRNGVEDYTLCGIAARWTTSAEVDVVTCVWCGGRAEAKGMDVRIGKVEAAK